jgi:hypothetical protein
MFGWTLRCRSTLLLALLGLLAVSPGCRSIAGYDPAPSEGDASRPLDASPDGALDAAADGAADAAADHVGVVDSGPPSGQIVRLHADPFGHAAESIKTNFAFVFAYRDWLYLGPRGDGRGAVRLKPHQPAQLEPISFALAQDGSSSNKSGPTLPGAGYGGCKRDTLECGPDNEDGRGLFIAGSWVGTPWLVLGGRRSDGKLRYVYATSDDGSSGQHQFSYVNLSKRLGGATEGISAGLFFNDRLLLGFADSGGSRPYLVSLAATPASYPSGLAVETDTQGISLKAHEIDPLGKNANNDAPTVQIDAMIGFAGEVYAFNNAGCARSRAPLYGTGYDPKKAWISCTPKVGFDDPGIEAPKAVDLLPRHKAFPQVAALDGVLYAARNSSKGPQLWRCDPGTSSIPGSDPSHCEGDEWELIGENLGADDNTNPGRAVMLLATSTRLYFAIEHPTYGLLVYRSSTKRPASRGDFEGRGVCSAAKKASDCPGLAGNGLIDVIAGDAMIVSLYDAKVLTFEGREGIYISAGDASGRVSVFALVE